MGRRREFDAAEVLRMVEERFWRDGYRATSMQEIAAATGVNPGSLFKCFGSKRNLYLAALRRYAEADSPRAFLLRSFDVPLTDALRGFYEEVIGRVERGGPVGCLVSNHVGELASVQDDVAEPSIELMRSTQQLLRLRLVWAREQGELEADVDIEALAAHLFCVLQGLYVLSASTRNVDDMRRASHLAVSVVERQLRRSPDGDPRVR
jgi:TetR/AcrR family transcriptional repressor of nem operon